MFDTLRLVIEAGGYALADMAERIDVLYAAGRLTGVERGQLLDMAASNADPDDGLPDERTRLGSLEERVAALEERVAKLEPGGSATAEPEGTDDAWPAYRRPESKDEQYRKADRITFTDGNHYVCVKNNVMDGPDVDPGSWEEATGE